MPDDRTSPSQQHWRWDPSLYAGSAGHYVLGRVPYPPQVAQTLVESLGLDRTGVMLDVGCGPGSLTLLLAPYVAEAIGVDADSDMLTTAASIATRRGIQNVRWKHLRAEHLPGDLPSPRVITLAQSFHWMDRPRVAQILRDMLEPGGALVHVSATTHWGAGAEQTDRAGAPPWRAIETLVATYLGSDRRAGQGTRGAERREEVIKHRAETEEGQTVNGGNDEIEAVQENQFWIFREILDPGVVGREIAAARHPANVRPPETVDGGRMNILLMIRMLVMVPVSRCPPERSALDGSIPPHREDKLHEPRSAKGAMGKIPVVEAGNRKHASHVEKRREGHRRPAPAHKKYGETAQMKEEK